MVSDREVSHMGESFGPPLTWLEYVFFHSEYPTR